MRDDLTEKIIGAAMEVHSNLGPGLLESTYEEAMCREFEIQNIPFKRQVVIDLTYKDRVIHGQRIDLLAFDEVVIEIKSVRNLPDVAMAQVLSYLKAAGLKRGLLINFGASHLRNGIKRISL
ncbi:MAG: GxxExxY protein [Burkholderiales bacterium]|nr:GxxExxY protein [Burkholderiales bacterium]